KRCNYAVWSTTRVMLNELMMLHNDVSHNYSLDKDDFVIIRISGEQKKILDVNAHNAVFWEAFNNSKKLKI
ncbi:MAG: hypothetical protein QXT26_08395, partial [Thermoproteota archaeon]